jgi:hypothetical protein
LSSCLEENLEKLDDPDIWTCSDLAKLSIYLLVADRLTWKAVDEKKKYFNMSFEREAK